MPSATMTELPVSAPPRNLTPAMATSAMTAATIAFFEEAMQELLDCNRPAGTQLFDHGQGKARAARGRSARSRQTAAIRQARAAAAGPRVGDGPQARLRLRKLSRLRPLER